MREETNAANDALRPGDGDLHEPKIAQKSPYPVHVEKGRTYYWCACGLSDRQPFCSGAHKGTPFKPVAWTAAESGTVYFCGCKHTQRAPLCDGNHRRLRSM